MAADGRQGVTPFVAAEPDLAEDDAQVVGILRLIDRLTAARLLNVGIRGRDAIAEQKAPRTLATKARP